MHGGIHSSDVRAEFSKILNNFSSFLLNRKQSGVSYLPLSEDSKEIMDFWGQINNHDKNQDQLPDQSSKATQSIKGEIPLQFSFMGPVDAKVFILDSEGIFFKGDAGELFSKILGAMNLSPEDVFICNHEDAKEVHAKIKEVSPKVIITLGEKAGQFLLNMNKPLEQFRGKFFEYSSIKVMPTFHPSLLLKQPGFKRQVWEDMKKVMAFAGL